MNWHLSRVSLIWNLVLTFILAAGEQKIGGSVPCSRHLSYTSFSLCDLCCFPPLNFMALSVFLHLTSLIPTWGHQYFKILQLNRMLKVCLVNFSWSLPTVLNVRGLSVTLITSTEEETEKSEHRVGCGMTKWKDRRELRNVESLSAPESRESYEASNTGVSL